MTWRWGLRGLGHALLACLLACVLTGCGADGQAEKGATALGDAAADGIALDGAGQVDPGDAGGGQDDAADGDPDASGAVVDTDEGDVDAAADAGGQARGMPTVATGFVPGGLLARQFAIPFSTSGHALDVDPAADATVVLRGQWIAGAVDLPPDAALWSEPWQPASFFQARERIDLHGAVDVPAGATQVTLAFAFIGSLAVEVGGETVLDVRDRNTLGTEQLTLPVQAPGWLPLTIRYAPTSFARHLQAWDTGAATTLPLGGDRLGFGDQAGGSVTGEATLAAVGYYGAEVHITAALPCRAEILTTDGKVLAASPPGLWQSAHVVPVPLLPGQTTKLSVRLVDPWATESTVSLAPIETPALPVFVAGGPHVAFFDGVDLGKLVMRAVQAQVDHPPGKGAFGSLAPVDKFSARWTGGVFVPTTGTYTLSLGSDDGQRVWLDGVLVVDDWTGHGITYFDVTRELVAGWHVLQMEVYDSGGDAAAVLEWKPPGGKRVVVPSTSLGYVAPVAASADVPALLAPSVERLDKSSVRIKAATQDYATLLVQALPDAATPTQHDVLLPADGFVVELPAFGAAAGKVRLTPMSLGGKPGAVVELAVPGA